MQVREELQVLPLLQDLLLPEQEQVQVQAQALLPQVSERAQVQVLPQALLLLPAWVRAQVRLLLPAWVQEREFPMQQALLLQPVRHCSFRPLPWKLP